MISYEWIHLKYFATFLQRETTSASIAGLWNYQILFFVNGQVNGQNPLVQQRFTCPNIDIFLISQKQEKCVVDTH